MALYGAEWHCTFEYPSLRQAVRGPYFAIARIGEAILIVSRESPQVNHQAMDRD